jgi:hypothetical protein
MSHTIPAQQRHALDFGDLDPDDAGPDADAGDDDGIPLAALGGPSDVYVRDDEDAAVARADPPGCAACAMVVNAVCLLPFAALVLWLEVPAVDRDLFQLRAECLAEPTAVCVTKAPAPGCFCMLDYDQVLSRVCARLPLYLTPDESLADTTEPVPLVRARHMARRQPCHAGADGRSGGAACLAPPHAALATLRPVRLRGRMGASEVRGFGARVHACGGVRIPYSAPLH